MRLLETSPGLQQLKLAGCQLGAEGGRAIITAIGADRDHFRLEDVDLSFNCLGGGTGKALERALRRNETLTRLSLRWVPSLVQTTTAY